MTNASTPNTNTPSPTRLDRLDLARFLALAGVVIVNFKIVSGAGSLGILAGALKGRAVVTFLVLAGVGQVVESMTIDTTSNRLVCVSISC